MECTIINYISIFLSGCLLFGVFKLFVKLWWTPMRIQRFMRSQGIQGPSFKFIQGNTRDVYIKRMQAMATPMDLSHNILHRVMPCVHSWLNLYGTKIILNFQLLCWDSLESVIWNFECKWPTKWDLCYLRLWIQGLEMCHI